MWLQVFTVIEVKAKRDASSLSQLATYVKQIFMEQFDRLFVLALSLHDDHLRIHLFDRSGIISSSAINIHKVSVHIFLFQNRNLSRFLL